MSKMLSHEQRILQACRHAARNSKDKDLYVIITRISKSPEQPKKVRKLLKNKSKAINLTIKKKPVEAQAFLLNNNISKEVYTNMRLEVKACGANGWPSYNEIREAKGECRQPKGAISVKETEVEVTLQALLNHIIRKISKVQKDAILQPMENTNDTVIEAVLLCSWGFDGSSGHSEYKQSYKYDEVNLNVSDGNLFRTTLILLRLLSKCNIILWNNRTPQSARFCRPRKFQIVKELKSLILTQKQNVENQINQLQVLEVKLNDTRILIHFSLFLMLIDGKILNIITGAKSMQTCPICRATPRTFNDVNNKRSNTLLPDVNALVHGISPLNAWIRIFECYLHISYRVNLKV